MEYKYAMQKTDKVKINSLIKAEIIDKPLPILRKNRRHKSTIIRETEL